MMTSPANSQYPRVAGAGLSMAQQLTQRGQAAAGAAVKSGDSYSYMARQGMDDATRAGWMEARTANKELIDMALRVAQDGVQDAARGPMTQSQRAQLLSAVTRAALYDQLPTKGQHVQKLATTLG